MKNKEKLVSIILNCFNGEQYLKEALNSIKNQTYKNWELIFWDNKSTDKSKQIFKSFKNSKFKYFIAKKHTSLYSAKNLAIKKSKGEFISFIDVDDTWERNKLELQVKLFEDKEVAVVYGNSWLKNEKFNKKKKFINYKIEEGYIYKSLIKKYNVGILTAIIRKSFLKKKFNNKYNIIGDYDLFLSLAKKFKFKAIQNPVATYRIHENNLSNLKKDREIFEFKDWLKNNKKKLENHEIKTIKKKIIQLNFYNLKYKKYYFKAFLFFSKNIHFLFSLKNLFVLFIPNSFLKKTMWFY